MKSLTQFTTERKKNHEKTLVTYITAGLPGWVDAIHAACENGADIVEIGLPFSDPIMDGPIIAEASARALAGGAKTLDLLEVISNEKFSQPIAIMTYTNVLYVHGVKEIVSELAKDGVTGLILPDLTFEQSGMFSDVLANTDISLIQLVASTTDVARRDHILAASEGFLYCIAIKGITGQNVDIAHSFNGFISEIQSLSSVPTYCGVGIRTPDDARVLSQLCDGVIVGTSIVEKMIDNSHAASDIGVLVQSLREAIDS